MAMLALSGRFPSLLKAIAQWWLTTAIGSATADWAEQLLAQGSLEYRLQRMWNGLTQEEQLALSEIHKLKAKAVAADNVKRSVEELAKRQEPALGRLIAKGLCQQTDAGWQILGDLLAAYVAQAEGSSRGKIWLDEKTRTLYQGQTLIEGLTSLQKAVLSYLVKNPRVQHTVALHLIVVIGTTVSSRLKSL